jgi:hypothetical protein
MHTATHEGRPKVLIGLKIDLFSMAAVRDTLPGLLELLRGYEVQASFFPALGPDPGLRRGRWAGMLRRPPAVGQTMREALLELTAAGHEVGAVPIDVRRWRKEVLERDTDWTRRQLERGAEAYTQLFGRAPHGFAAPGLLANADTPAAEVALGLDYAVDCRGLGAFFPVTAGGAVKLPQLPVTLPRIEDALGAGQPLEEVHQFVFMETQRPLLPGHVFSFTAGDPAWLPVLERLLVMWMGSQRKVVPLRRLLDELDVSALPYHEMGLLQGPAGGLRFAVQGEKVGGRG